MTSLEEIRAARAKDKLRQQFRAAREADTVRKTADGRSTAPGTTQEQADRIPPGMVYDPETGGYADAAVQAKRKGPVMGALGNFTAGGVFVGEGIDEAIGAAKGEVAQEIARQSIDQYREDHPIASEVLRFGGGLTSAAPLGVRGASLVAKAPGPALKAAGAVAAGATAGATEGATSGYLRGRTREDRGRRSREDAMMGGGIGGATAGVGLGLAALTKAIVSRLKRLDVNVIAREFGIDPKAAKFIKRHIMNDDLAEAERLLARAGDDAMLADAGPGTAAALDAAAATGGKPLKVAKGRVDARAEAAQPKLVETLDRVLGAPEGKRSASKAISRRTAPARKAAYDAAYDTPINYASPEGRAIEAVLERVSPKNMRAAIDRAQDAMRDDGVVNRQIMAKIGDDGSVVFEQMPDVRQLDYLKQALGTIADDGTDALTGQVSDSARRAGNQATALRDALKAATGGDTGPYARALKLGGDNIAQRNSLRLGNDLLSPKTTVEDVREWAKTASEADKAALRQGLRQDIEKRMGDVRSTVSDGATDAREAIKATLDTSSRNARAKIKLALGKDAGAFTKGMDESRAALELRAAMAANSKTAIRQAGREAANELIEPNAVQSLLMGRPGAAIEKTTAAATGLNDLPTERREELLGQVADVLTRMRGREAREALRTVRLAIEGQPISDAQSAKVAKLVGSASFTSLHQGLSQLTETSGQ